MFSHVVPLGGAQAETSRAFATSSSSCKMSAHNCSLQRKLSAKDMEMQPGGEYQDQHKHKAYRKPPPPPPTANFGTSCVQQVADAVLQLNRELVAQNIWLREQLTADLNKDKSGSRVDDTDAKLRLENEKLRQQVQDLENKLEKKQEIALLSAKVIQSRITFRDSQQFVEYKLQLETDCRGTLFVWHRYSTFRKLAETLQTKQGHPRKSIPELPSKQIFGNFSEKIIQERVVKLNQFLEAATNSDHLQWGIRVDSDTCVYKRRKRATTPPSSSLKTKDWTLHSRKNDLHAYAFVSSAKVIDSRVQQQVERPIIEYQLRIKTDVHSIIFAWHPYNALYEWAETMQRENPSHKIPQLPKEEPFGSFSKHIQHQGAKIEAFFKNIEKLEHLQWVARVDGDMFVCKLRVRDPSLTFQHQHASECSSPYASVSKLFPLKSIVQRQRKRSDALLYERKMAQAS